jgi:peptidoglycan hydrolase-like protein with peptidoglycan-binding domain
MDILATSTNSAPNSVPFLANFAWFQLSKLPAKMLIHLLSIVLDLAIVSMANTSMALLQQGDSGEAVRKLRDRLMAAQCDDGSVNGDFGPSTQSAVVLCQQRYGLMVDGVVGPQTLSALEGESIAAQPESVGSHNMLLRGSHGAEVIELQRQLQEMGLYTAVIDGDFGPLTEQAVAHLQRRHSLQQTGVFGDHEKQVLAISHHVQLSMGTAIGRNQLTIGDAGQAVQQLQVRLKELRYFDAVITGYYDKLTKLAVQNFQVTRRLPVTGIADQQTLQVLGITAKAPVSVSWTNAATEANPFSSGGFTSRTIDDPCTLVDSGSTAAHSTTQTPQTGRFVVVIPSRRGVKLATVKQLVPDATEGKSSIGPYIQAGTFVNQNAAARQSRFLQAYGLDAQVAYR